MILNAVEFALLTMMYAIIILLWIEIGLWYGRKHIRREYISTFGYYLRMFISIVFWPVLWFIEWFVENRGL